MVKCPSFTVVSTHMNLAQSRHAMGTVLCPVCASTGDNTCKCLSLQQQLHYLREQAQKMLSGLELSVRWGASFCCNPHGHL